MRVKKVLATAMAMSMIMGMGVMTHAAEVSNVATAGTGTQADVLLTSEAALFSVNVPTSIRVDTGTDGFGTTEQHDIFNASDAIIKISQINLLENDVWSYSDVTQETADKNAYELLQCVDAYYYDIDATNADNIKHEGTVLYEDESADGNTAGVIGISESSIWTYDVQNSPVSEAIADDELCKLEYLFDWYAMTTTSME